MQVWVDIVHMSMYNDTARFLYLPKTNYGVVVLALKPNLVTMFSFCVVTWL